MFQLTVCAGRGSAEKGLIIRRSRVRAPPAPHQRLFFVIGRAQSSFFHRLCRRCSPSTALDVFAPDPGTFDATSVIVPGGLLREDMFELLGRRCDSSQWTSWIPRGGGTLHRCGEVLCPPGHPPQKREINHGYQGIAGTARGQASPLPTCISCSRRSKFVERYSSRCDRRARLPVSNNQSWRVSTHQSPRCRKTKANSIMGCGCIPAAAWFIAHLTGESLWADGLVHNRTHRAAGPHEASPGPHPRHFSTRWGRVRCVQPPG